jgi:glycogen operon protein
MGDEMRRTQHGNNNAYCQDNPISWLDWTLLERHADLHRFVSLLNARRLLRDEMHERRRVPLGRMIWEASKTWHGVVAGRPDWGLHSHSVALEAALPREGLRIYLVLNAYWEPLDFELPPAGAAAWCRWIDTAQDSPDDIVPWREARPVAGPRYPVGPRSVALLVQATGASP